MTKEELKDKNPWKRVAENFHANETDCLFLVEDKEQYVCTDDRIAIKEYNAKCAKFQKEDNQIITNTPPEPWRGNPLQANLILLSLNPGYDPNINESLAKLIQANKSVRKELIEFRQKTLNLTADSFMPPKDDKKPISCFEAEDMLSGWYWTNKFKELRWESGIEESEFYKRVAVIEFHGYSSKKYHKWFGNQPKYLESQEFNKLLIHFIVENRREEVCFLVLRSWNYWRELLNEKDKSFTDNNKELFLINDHNPRCQYLTKKNMTPNVWNEIITAIKKVPKKEQ